MSEFMIFYAWQSDTSPKINRYFIRDALNQAIKNIKTDIEIDDSIRLDSDTSGVSGMPEIAATIFNKINRSGIFLADLTFVGSTDKSKLFPNPNVMLELGHATAKIGWDRTICVMNTHYGNSDEVIFDIKHRRYPICYSYSENELPNKSVVQKNWHRTYL